MITLTLGKFSFDEWNNKSSDLLLAGEKVGTVHQNGYAPRWAFQINKFRWKHMTNPLVQTSSPYDLHGLARLLFDGAAWDTAKQAKDSAECQLQAFERRLVELEKGTP